MRTTFKLKEDPTSAKVFRGSQKPAKEEERIYKCAHCGAYVGVTQPLYRSGHTISCTFRSRLTPRICKNIPPKKEHLRVRKPFKNESPVIHSLLRGEVNEPKYIGGFNHSHPNESKDPEFDARQSGYFGEDERFTEVSRGPDKIDRNFLLKKSR